MVKSPFNCGIYPLNEPQVANQQQQKNLKVTKPKYLKISFKTCAPQVKIKWGLKYWKHLEFQCPLLGFQWRLVFQWCSILSKTIGNPNKMLSFCSDFQRVGFVCLSILFFALIAIPRFARAGKHAIKIKKDRQTEQKLKGGNNKSMFF